MDEIDGRDSIVMFAMILEEVLMRYFVRCGQDWSCTIAGTRCGLLCCVCDFEMMIADEIDSRDSIFTMNIIKEEVLMRNFVRCEQDSWPENARSRMQRAMLCVRFRDDDCGRSGQQGQYRCVCYDFRRGIDAIFRAVRAGFRLYECKVEMRPVMLCVRFRDVENGRSRQQGQ